MLKEIVMTNELGLDNIYILAHRPGEDGMLYQVLDSDDYRLDDIMQVDGRKVILIHDGIRNEQDAMRILKYLKERVAG